MQKTNLNFVSWFNSYQANYGAFKGLKIKDVESWSKIWDKLSIIYSDQKFNLIEFLALNTIFIIETKGTFVSQTEKISVDRAFNNIGKKSYNTLSGNITAGNLFKNSVYITKFQQLPLANILANTNNIKWHGEIFPFEVFEESSLEIALRIDVPTFVNECDFYKFRDRGIIKIKERINYIELIKFIINYSGNNSKLLQYKSIWSAAPYDALPLDVRIQMIATHTTNKDWDELFNIIELLVYSVKLYLEKHKNCHIISLTTEAEVEAKLKNLSNKISNDNFTYQKDFLEKIRQQISDLDDLI